MALTSGFTAPVNATMTVGQLSEILVVTGATPPVDVQNARQAITFEGDQIKELPTSRNITSLLNLTPGISSNYQSPTSSSPFGAPGICVGGIGVFCNPGVNGFNNQQSGVRYTLDGMSAFGMIERSSPGELCAIVE